MVKNEKPTYLLQCYAKSFKEKKQIYATNFSNMHLSKKKRDNKIKFEALSNTKYILNCSLANYYEREAWLAKVKLYMYQSITIL